ncbi:hypothetical protein FAZ15_12735 [Sphingobacterium olei]|uniref:DUF748 domain-containing protein n=1 Tax=Sphingobacterium olei TaxID=2571155 RepID=A0A4U0NY50_9SPHI|nr:hypothetical protein [Sphingobacterium olei]TJZ59761.1 hypothetical protein FAZ15_12735 [Sphingobacterium olei]
MKPIWKWILIILALLLLAVGGVVWYYGRNWKPILETKLKEVVHNSSNGLYTLTYDDLDLNIGLGNVTLREVELIPDSAIYQQMIVEKSAPDNRFHIKLKALKIRRFGLWDVLRNRQLSIKSIVLEQPEIHLTSEKHAFNDTVSTEPKKTLYESIEDIFTSVNVRDVQLDDVKFTYSKIDSGKTSGIELNRVTIKVHDVLVDKTSIDDSTRLFYTKMIDVHVPGFEYELPDGFYKLKFDDLSINTKDQNLLLTKFAYEPKMAKSAFFKQKNRNITMTILKFDTLRLENLDFKELIDNQKTIAASAQLKNGIVDLSNDRRYPKYPKNKIGRSPHQQLMKLNSLIRLDTVLVDNVTITYHEFSAKYGREGSISFNHARGNLTNVTNDTLALAKDKFMRADLSAKIMNSGRLHAKFGFDMLSTNGYHTYKGSVGAMNATAFNRILKPLLNVELASGNMKKVTFNMEGTDYRNWGDFRFDYDNLKIRLLNEQKKGEAQTSKKVISFFVNQIIINDSNPDANEIYHIGKINYKRDPEHTFFKTLWQSLLDGIKQTAGISPEREARLMGTAAKAQDAVKESNSAVNKTKSFIRGIFKKKEKSEDSDEK